MLLALIRQELGCREGQTRRDNAFNAETQQHRIVYDKGLKAAR